MRWLGRNSSNNVEDRRGMSGGGLAIGGGLGTVVIVVISLLLGKNPMEYINVGQEEPTQQVTTEASNQQAKFVGVVLADTELIWGEIFKEQLNKEYEQPKLVLFTQGTQSGCGSATSATGPFYCPVDRKVYIDLSFYDDLQQRFKAPGDFAMAYVVAHEVGHHVQNLLGIADKVREQQQNLSEKEINELSVRLELQADFFAGVWAHNEQKMKDVIEAGDIDEALGAANAIGDDRLQKQSQGYVVPDAFTHGTSAQRVKWFKKGYESGDLNQGDTFSAEDL